MAGATDNELVVETVDLHALDPDGWFHTLGIPVDAENGAIRAARRRLMLSFHNDKRGGDLTPAEQDANDKAVEHIKRITDILQDTGLRATYHSRGAKDALAGVRLDDGSAALHIDKQMSLTIQQLCTGGEEVIEVFSRFDDRQRRRVCTVSWTAGTPADSVIVLRGKGHSKILSHPYKPGEHVRRTGDVRVHLQATVDQAEEGGEGADMEDSSGTARAVEKRTLAADGEHLRWVVRAPLTKFLARSPLHFHHPDGVRHLILVPPPEKPFAPCMVVPHAGISKDGELWIYCVGMDAAAAETIVPDEAARLLCEANGWEVPVPSSAIKEHDGLVDLVSGASEVILCADIVTETDMRKRKEESARDIASRSAAASGEAMFESITVVPSDDAAAASQIIPHMNVQGAESVTQCAQQ